MNLSNDIIIDSHCTSLCNVDDKKLQNNFEKNIFYSLKAHVKVEFEKKAFYEETDHLISLTRRYSIEDYINIQNEKNSEAIRLMNKDDFYKFINANKKGITNNNIEDNSNIYSSLIKPFFLKYNSFIGSCKTSLFTARLIDISKVSKINSKASSINNNNTKNKIKNLINLLINRNCNYNLLEIRERKLLKQEFCFSDVTYSHFSQNSKCSPSSNRASFITYNDRITGLNNELPHSQQQTGNKQQHKIISRNNSNLKYSK
ncbi:hypothetical protein H8356DRAFT_1342329 [Neocallimastix lanati (nom. inval.)]|nr:hypothetical protein H8356DRAFT_1342329 [Neocallimastix sp. JGI-2020a]